MACNESSMIRGSLTIAIACLALSGAAAAGEESQKPAKVAADEATAPKREIPGAEERAQRITDQMKERLGLTEEQVPRVAEINLRVAKQVDELRTAGEGRSERVSKRRAIQRRRNRELRTVLTQQQWEQFRKMQDEMASKARDRLREERKAGVREREGGLVP